MKIFKYTKNIENIGLERRSGITPRHRIPQGETPTPLADLADLAPNPVQFQALTSFLYY